MTATVTQTKIEELLEAVFSALSVPKYYKQYSCGSVTNNKQKSFKIKKMKMFVILDKARPDTENIRGLNLAAVKCLDCHGRISY
jgi:hypothetical protein